MKHLLAILLAALLCLTGLALAEADQADESDKSGMPIEDAQLDAALVGTWLEQDTQFTTMTLEKNPERGWDVEVVSPVSHGAFVFSAHVQLDGTLNRLVYDDGAFRDIDGTYDPSADPGEARGSGTRGGFTLSEADGSLALSWYDDERPEDVVVFTRVDAPAPLPSQGD